MIESFKASLDRLDGRGGDSCDEGSQGCSHEASSCWDHRPCDDRSQDCSQAPPPREGEEGKALRSSMQSLHRRKESSGSNASLLLQDIFVQLEGSRLPSSACGKSDLYESAACCSTSSDAAVTAPTCAATLSRLGTGSGTLSVEFREVDFDPEEDALVEGRGDLKSSFNTSEGSWLPWPEQDYEDDDCACDDLEKDWKGDELLESFWHQTSSSSSDDMSSRSPPPCRYMPPPDCPKSNRARAA